MFRFDKCEVKDKLKDTFYYCIDLQQISKYQLAIPNTKFCRYKNIQQKLSKFEFFYNYVIFVIK